MDTFEEIQAKLETVSAISKQWLELEAGLKRQRDNLCPHSELENKHHYFPGSYYDTSYTEMWQECKVCHKKFNEHHRDNGYYG